jgi:putative membrane protein
MPLIPVLLFLLLNTRLTLAHEGGAIPADVWTHWNTDPLLLIGLLLPLALYLRGTWTYPVAHWRTAAFITGIGTLFIALISPLEAMSGSLFSAHMIQHLLLVLVAAPLLVLSRPTAPVLRGLPVRWRKAAGNTARIPVIHKLWTSLTRPVTASSLHLMALWLWHVPALYSAAIAYEALHILEHASFFLTAALFWWSIQSAGQHGVRVLAVFGVMMASGLLGALMTFARSAWYSDHAAYVSAWGLTLLEDQQLAGMFMWIPAGFVYVVTAGVILGAWLNSVEQRLVKELRDA